MSHIKPLGSQGQMGKIKIQKPKTKSPMSFSKLCLEMVRDSSHYHKFPWKLKRLLYQKKKVQRLLVKSELSFRILFEAHRLQKLLVAVPRGGICWHQKSHLASSTSKKQHEAAFYHKQANVASSIRSCQNQTKTAGWFKIAKRGVHMKFRAISTTFGLTSLLQQQSRSSRRPWSQRPCQTKQSTWVVSKYH